MAYDNPVSLNYHIENYDFGADTDTSYYFSGPAGYKGRLKSISASATETFACATTAASVQVGTSGDADAYGKLNIADETAANAVYNSEDDTDAVISADITADSQFIIKCVQGTDDAADAGKASVDVVINWFK